MDPLSSDGGPPLERGRARRLPFARRLLGSALVAAAACFGLTVLVEIRQAVSLPQRFVDVIFPLLSLGALFWGPWRRPLRLVGYPAADRAREALLWGIAGSLAGCLIFLQVGVPRVLAELETIEGPAALAANPRARFVELKAFQGDYAHCKPVWDWTNQTDQSSGITANVYLICPFTDAPNIWMVALHSEYLSHAKMADEAARTQSIGEIAERADAQFREQLPERVQYFERLRNDRAARKLTAALTDSAETHPILLLAHMTPYEKSGANFLYASAACALVFLVLVLVVPLARVDEADEPPVVADGAPPGRKTSLGSALDIFVPGRVALATPLLLDLNIAVFLLMTLTGVDPLSPLPEDLLRWGANQKTALVAGQAWRLFTYQFVHAGVIHLLMNGVLLALGGLLLENIAGWRWVFVTYLFGGAVGGLLSAFTHGGASVGASGSILAIVGALLVLGYSRFVPDRGIGNWAVGLAVANLLIGFKAGIDGAAHAGGLLGGLLCGAAVYLQKARREDPPGGHVT